GTSRDLPALVVERDRVAGDGLDLLRRGLGAQPERPALGTQEWPAEFEAQRDARRKLERRRLCEKLPPALAPAHDGQLDALPANCEIDHTVVAEADLPALAERNRIADRDAVQARAVARFAIREHEAAAREFDFRVLPRHRAIM